MVREIGQLHLVTDDGIGPSDIVSKVGFAVRAGVDVVQVRYPQLGARELSRIVRAIQRESATSKSAVIVNDRVDVAMALGANGVHLGHRSLPIDVVRRITTSVGRHTVVPTLLPHGYHRECANGVV